MAKVFILPTKDFSPIATSYQRQNALISKLMAGHAGLSLSNMNGAGVPQVRAGSVIDVSNRLFAVPAGADEEISGSPSEGQNYVYAVTNPNGATFQYSAVKPVWNKAKCGWYNGADRAVAKFVYADGRYTQKKILGKRRSGEYTSVQNPGDVVEFYQGGVMRARLKMIAAGLLMAGMLTACDGVFSRGDIRTNDPNGWLSATAPSGAWNSIAYGNGKFVAVGSNATAYSVDGINWSIGTIPSGAWSSIAYGNDKFVAVGNSAVAYSVDGINWLSATAYSGAWSSITYGNGKFVVAGSSIGIYSADGINWSVMRFNTGGLKAIAYGNNRFVAVGNGMYTEYSTNGINWTLENIPNIGTWNSIAYGNGKFVAVGSNATAYSVDGINWSIGTIPSGAWSSITYGNDKFVAVGSNATAYSVDGINWSIGTIPTGAWSSIAYGNDKFVAVGTNTVAYSALIQIKLVFNADGSVGWKKA